MESTYKDRPKIIIPMMLCAVLLISLGINVWLYIELTALNRSITGVQTELAGIQKEYDALSLKIEDGKGSLSELQKENKQAEQRIANQQTKQVLSPTTEQKQQLNPQPQNKLDQNKPEQTKPSTKPDTKPSKPADNGNSGGNKPTEWDKDGNGIKDSLEGYGNGDGSDTTESDPDFRLH